MCADLGKLANVKIDTDKASEVIVESCSPESEGLDIFLYPKVAEMDMKESWNCWTV